MAVLYACSFEAGLTAYYQEAGWTMTLTTVVSTLRRHLTPGGIGGAYTVDSPSGVLTLPGQTAGTARWIHFAMQSRAAPGTINMAFLRSGGSTFFVRVNASGTIDLLRGSGNITAATLVATSAGTTNMATMHWFAIQLDALDAGGTAEVWVDGALAVSYTGDTKGHATLTQWDQFQWNGLGGVGANDITIDDVIVTDSTTGRVAEQFCLSMVPNSVVSGNLTGVPTTGASRYQNVDEIPASQVDYNEAASALDEDLYGLTDPAAPTSVLCAVVWTEATRAGAITSIAPSVSSGATTVYATPTVLPTSGYGVVPYVVESDPDTALPWTASGLNGMRAGARFS